MLATYLLLLVVMSKHALADTTKYSLFDPSIPVDGRDWFGWVAVLRCAMRTESVVTSKSVWRRQPMIVKSSILNLIALMIVCDPLVGAFALAPQNAFLQFWSLHLMPWLRFTWMVGTTSWVTACVITSGDRGYIYADPRCVIEESSATTSPAVFELADGCGEGGQATSNHNNSNTRTNGAATKVRRKRSTTFKILIALTFFPSALYLASVIAASLAGQPSEPAAFGTGHGMRMMGSAIGMELWGPITLLAAAGFYRRTLYARFPNGVDECDEVSAFGVPSARNQGRVFVVAVRFLLPYCVWTSLFMAGSYFGVLLVVTSLLPSYYNGHLVEVLVCVLLGWTVALSLVPLRKSLLSHPPRPCTFPAPPESTTTTPFNAAPPSSPSSADPSSQQLRSFQQPLGSHHHSTPLLLQQQQHQQYSQPLPRQQQLLSSYRFEPSVPLWCQIPWTEEYLVNLKTGLVPNCGYAFQSEVQEMIFDNIQRNFIPPPTAIHQSSVLSTKRSFFCWETAVRALNMSKEAYNLIEGGRDISHLASTEVYEQSFCEKCITNRCCCCCFGGGCGGCGGCGDNDVDVTGDGDESATTDVIRGIDDEERDDEAEERHRQRDNNDGRFDLRASRSSRRFTEVSAVARASRQSVANRRQRTESQIFDSRQQSSYAPELNNEGHGGGPLNRQEDEASENSSPAPLARQDTGAPPSSSNSTSMGPGEAGDSNNGNPDRHLNNDSPPKSMTGTSSPTSNNAAANSSSGLPKQSLAAIEERPTKRNQIDVTRYGYELVKVLDVFGVRVVIAATPPGTTGRHPHLCISFRGTVNLRNALTDANARMLEHPEMLGGAEVHRGFWLAFEKLLPALVATLQEFFLLTPDSTCSATGERLSWTTGLTSILCTGHSLGGALAMLCAYSCTRGTLHRDVFSRLPFFFPPTAPHQQQQQQPPQHFSQAPPLQYFQSHQASQPQPPTARVRCYTFGSPRLGNAYLSHVYNIAVPETYRIINENDIVARVGLCWQEHAGREVRMNRDGDAMIEGTYLETDYTLTKGVGSSIKNHYLIRYGNSMDNCLCSRNLKMLSPDCCSFLMIHLDEERGGGEEVSGALVSSPQTLAHHDDFSEDGGDAR
ncbi:lipase, putative [Bodo saltans]|uniref:Lipase, putative n=1 Tax=Bodo saltans TaxID=75058 RepID=A0A0S4ITM3_BODSA|nr:lipase, putative [Bodo saltans]|eukprot:CUF78590.1 lipase, putative [Bodo saltans]